MDPYIGEIRMVGFNFAPTGWAMCDGQLLPISQNTALFSLLGTQFGGNGSSNFQLPNLQGNVMVGQGQGIGLSPYDMGETGGVTAVTLLTSEVPSHTHNLNATAASATTALPNAAFVAEAHGSGRGGTGFAVTTYAVTGTATTLAPGQLGTVPGGNQPHNNMQPFLAMNYIIALLGVFPARS